MSDTKETKRPRDVKSVREFYRMESDSSQGDGWSILHNGNTVSLHAPVGSRGTWVSIPKKDFDAIVDWYMAPQPLAPPPPVG